VFLHPQKETFAFELLQEALQIVVEVIELGHLAGLLDSLLGQLGDLDVESLAEQSLRFLNFLDGVFGDDLVQFWDFGSDLFEGRVVLTLDDSEN
jgi:hypothetical protein